MGKGLGKEEGREEREKGGKRDPVPYWKSEKVATLASAACDECSGSRHSELCDHVKPALKQLYWLSVEQSRCKELVVLVVMFVI